MPDTFSFESQFRGAIRPRYRHEPLALERVLVVTDLAPERAEAVRASAQRLLGGLPATSTTTWDLVTAEAFPSLPDLVARVAAEGPGLIVASRNLGESPRHPDNSLGTYVDNLTQAVDVPVLLLPVRRDADEGARELVAQLADTDRVLVVTDHLTEDPQLVRWGAELTAKGGRLYLAHVEDEAVFERYMGVIARIPEIDDDVARRALGERLLKEARDAVSEAAQGLADRDLVVEPMVTFGEPLAVMKAWLAEHAVDLVIADAKDPRTAAMSAFAHTLAVELLDTPLLLL